MAFGATPRVIVAELLKRATRSVTIGLIAGLALALGATRFLPDAAGNFDFGYAGVVVVVLLTSSLVASFVPALRARKASPNLLLREA
jgi:ABC-type antimicrobial peptide transport system permease subunit